MEEYFIDILFFFYSFIPKLLQKKSKNALYDLTTMQLDDNYFSDIILAVYALIYVMY